LITRWGFAWKTASRFVAGDNLADAIRVVERLNSKGINATLDLLGEHTSNEELAKKCAQDILSIFEAIDRSGVRANVSIKLSQIGLAIDEELCAQNLQKILEFARQKDNFVRIDMEDSPWVETTLSLYRRMRQKGFTNAGVVIQAYLYRSQDDVRWLAEEGGRVRLCKGAYKEPPEIAFPKKSDVDKNFDKLTQLLIDAVLEKGGIPSSLDAVWHTPPVPAIASHEASHDPDRLDFAKQYTEQVNLPKHAMEVQMLYGIRRDLQLRFAEDGYPVRVYVPFGTEWYPYFVRRLAERPANLWFFLSNFFRK
jgi:proline dehydrogenase